MNTILITIIMTLLIYSLISTIIYILSKENENVAIILGISIIGLVIMGISQIVWKIKHLYKYHDKRSIIENTNTCERKYCNLKDAEDIYYWHDSYKLIKKYATKNEWSNLQPFNKEFIIYCKQNCDKCIHYTKYGECKHIPTCKDDKYQSFEFK